MTVTLYHNPDCGTSRNVLTILEAGGNTPRVIDYREAGWQPAVLSSLLTAAGLTPRAALRITGTPAGELGLSNPEVDDTTVFEAMLAHPILVNRPFVVTPKGVALCRPSTRVLDLMDIWPPAPFTLPDGTRVLDEGGDPV